MAGLYKDHSEIEMLQNITGTKIEKRLVLKRTAWKIDSRDSVQQKSVNSHLTPHH